jgi:hypothetical protein
VPVGFGVGHVDVVAAEVGSMSDYDKNKEVIYEFGGMKKRGEEGRR